MILINHAMMGAAGNAAVAEQQIRYLRTTITSLWYEGSAYGELCGVQFYDRPRDSIVPVNTITSTDKVATGAVVDNLIDGIHDNLSNRWVPAVSDLPHVFVVDFGALVSVNSIVFYGGIFDPTRVLKDFFVDASEDGATWNQVFSAQSDYDLLVVNPRIQEFSFS